MEVETETVLRNLSTMLKSRGADTTELDNLNTSEKYGDISSKVITVSLNVEDDPVPITVFICLTSRDTVKAHIADITKNMTMEKMINKYNGSNKFVFVYKPLEKPSQSTLIAPLEERDKQLQTVNGYFQIFKVMHLMFDPAAHVLVPTHIKMHEDEVKELLEKYQLKNRFHLPNILRKDVMARYLGLNHGDVVKILRYNNTAGTYTYYRCCIKT